MQSGLCAILLCWVGLVSGAQASSFHRPGDRYPRQPSPPDSSIPSVQNVGTSSQGTSQNGNGFFAKMSRNPVSIDSIKFPLAPSPQFPSNRRHVSVGSETWSWDWHGVQTPGVKILDYQPPQRRWGPSGRREYVEQGTPIYKQQPGFGSAFRLPERDREVLSYCVCSICLIWSYQPRRFPCSKPYPKAPQPTSLPDPTTPKTFSLFNPETTSPDLYSATQPSEGNFGNTNPTARTPYTTTAMETTTTQTPVDYYDDISAIPEPA